MIDVNMFYPVNILGLSKQEILLGKLLPSRFEVNTVLQTGNSKLKKKNAYWEQHDFGSTTRRGV